MKARNPNTIMERKLMGKSKQFEEIEGVSENGKKGRDGSQRNRSRWKEMAGKKGKEKKGREEK